jgi:hypothetical protein
VPEVIPGEVDVFARVEHVDGGRVAQDMNVAPIGWKIRLGCLEAEEILYPGITCAQHRQTTRPTILWRHR